MKKIIILLLSISTAWTNGTFEYQEYKKSGTLENKCKDQNFYFALYNYDARFKNKYDEINKKFSDSSSAFINEGALRYFPNQIDSFWDELSESQQKRMNRWCEIDERIRSVTASEADDEINFAAIIYQMPDLKFIIDAYIISPPQLYYSIDYWLHYEPYFEFTRYLVYLDEKEFEKFMIDYQNIYQKLKDGEY